MENPEEKSPRDMEIERLRKLPTAPYDSTRPPGVLLQDQIEFYAKEFALLKPFSKECLKPAAYELRVGHKYSVAEKTYTLNLGERLTIPRFEVAVIQILETINMPRFLIGRWNIRTRWAYQGLLWVGGPQVDPGYRGVLLCPLYNLSNREFSIRCGDPIAVMDFVMTTPPREDLEPYGWERRTRIVFEDYDPHSLRSGLVTEAVEKIDKVRSEVDTIENRIDNFIGITFTVTGLLFAAVTLFVGKPENAKYWWDPGVFWACTVALTIAMLAWVRSKSPGRWQWVVELGIFLAAGLVLFSQAYRTQTQIRDLTSQVEELEKRISPPPAAE